MLRRKFFLYVSLRFVKFLATALIPNIINFFNFWYSRDIFSADWKVFSKFIQLPRISNLTDFSNFHPIAICHHFRRLFRYACLVKLWNT
jgi:hypothetical protein